MSLAKKISTGVIWNFAEQLARRGLGAVITLLLAKFLTPEDYGLVAMMTIFLAIASSLMDSGFKSSLIRLKDASQTDINTALFANIVLGVFSYILLYLSAPYIATFYKEARLTELVRVAGIAIIINSFQVVQMAMLSRALNFKGQLKASLPAACFSGLLAVWLAYEGFGVWALIAQSLTAAFITTLLFWYFNSWRPTLSFCLVSLKSMYKFGYKLFISGFINIVFENLYVIVIAKNFTVSIAGFYFFATKINDIIITQLSGSIQNVSYPALCTFQNDDIRLKSGYKKVIIVSTFMLFPTIYLVAALAKPLFILLFPIKWLPAVPYLQLLCISGALYPLHSINLNILQVKGRSDIFLYLEIYKKIMLLFILNLSFQFGVKGILIGQIIHSVLAYVPNCYFSSKLIQYPVWEQIKDFLPALLLSGSASFCVYGLVSFFDWHPLNKLLVFGVGFWIFYLTGAYMLKLKVYEMGKELFYNKYTSKRVL